MLTTETHSLSLPDPPPLRGFGAGAGRGFGAGVGREPVELPPSLRATTTDLEGVGAVSMGNDASAAYSHMEPS